MPQIKSSRPLLKRPWLLATIGGATVLGLLSMCQPEETTAPERAGPAASLPPMPDVTIIYYNLVNDVPLAYGRTALAESCVEEAFPPPAGADEISISIRTRPTETSPPLAIETIVSRSDLKNRRERPSDTSDCTATVQHPAP